MWQVASLNPRLGYVVASSLEMDHFPLIFICTITVCLSAQTRWAQTILGQETEGRCDNTILDQADRHVVKESAFSSTDGKTHIKARKTRLTPSHVPKGWSVSSSFSQTWRETNKNDTGFLPELFPNIWKPPLVLLLNLEFYISPFPFKCSCNCSALLCRVWFVEPVSESPCCSFHWVWIIRLGKIKFALLFFQFLVNREKNKTFTLN